MKFPFAYCKMLQVSRNSSSHLVSGAGTSSGGTTDIRDSDRQRQARSSFQKHQTTSTKKNEIKKI